MELAGLLPFILIFAVFYLLLIRPQRNRQRQLLAMQQQLAPGHHVQTSAGLYATVSAIEDDSVILETSPGITSRWAKAAVVRILSDPAGPAGEAPDDAGEHRAHGGDGGPMEDTAAGGPGGTAPGAPDGPGGTGGPQKPGGPNDEHRNPRGDAPGSHPAA